MSTEQPMVAELEQLATEYPETATFLRSVALPAEHAGEGAERWSSTRDEPCDVIRIRRRPSAPSETVAP